MLMLPAQRWGRMYRINSKKKKKKKKKEFYYRAVDRAPRHLTKNALKFRGFLEAKLYSFPDSAQLTTHAVMKVLAEEFSGTK